MTDYRTEKKEATEIVEKKYWKKKKKKVWKPFAEKMIEN